MAKKLTEAERLKADAELLLRQQREVLAHAGAVLRDSSRELTRHTRDDIYPSVAAGTRHAAGFARHKIVDEVIPSIAGVVGSTLAAVDAARHNKNFENISGNVSKYLGRSAAVAVPVAKKAGVGKYIALGVGLAVLAGVGYVVWQTFRADDELWVGEDDE